MFYRPVGNKFLNECKPLAFWLSQDGLLVDFPDDEEIKSFSITELEEYCQSHKLDFEKIEMYR